MMIVAGDNPTRVRSEAAFAKLCGACPIPGIERRDPSAPALSWRPSPSQRRALSDRHRPHALAPADARLCRSRTAQGLSKKDIIRCLKRFVAREIYRALIDDHRARTAVVELPDALIAILDT